GCADEQSNHTTTAAQPRNRRYPLPARHHTSSTAPGVERQRQDTIEITDPATNTVWVQYRRKSERCQRARRLSELPDRSEEHTSELQSRFDLVCRLLLEKKKRTVGQSNTI